MEHYVEWKPFYSVGDATIDDQHKTLSRHHRRPVSATQAGHEPVVVREIVERLVAYTMTHFEHEEHVMWECGYPDFDAHKVMPQRDAAAIARIQGEAGIAGRKRPAAIREELVGSPHSRTKTGNTPPLSTLPLVSRSRWRSDPFTTGQTFSAVSATAAFGRTRAKVRPHDDVGRIIFCPARTAGVPRSG